MTRRHKYGAIATVTPDGIKHPSKREAKRWAELLLLEKAGEIKNLKRQVRYKLQLETTYIADFTYDWTHGGGSVVEDAKGFRTREYQRKARAMKVQHGIQVREV